LSEFGEKMSDSDEFGEKKRRETRAWMIVQQWDTTTEEEAHIESEILWLALEQMQLGAISSLKTFKTHDTDLGLWKVKDVYKNPNCSITITRYRCPLAFRCKCRAMLRVTRTGTKVIFEVADMHGPETHTVEKDQSKHLKWEQRESVAKAVQVAPLLSSTAVRRNLHRFSPEKKIAPEKSR
jgi:hypothetical protein